MRSAVVPFGNRSCVGDHLAGTQCVLVSRAGAASQRSPYPCVRLVESVSECGASLLSAGGCPRC